MRTHQKNPLQKQLLWFLLGSILPSVKLQPRASYVANVYAPSLLLSKSLCPSSPPAPVALVVQGSGSAPRTPRLWQRCQSSWVEGGQECSEHLRPKKKKARHKQRIPTHSVFPASHLEVFSTRVTTTAGTDPSFSACAATRTAAPPFGRAGVSHAPWRKAEKRPQKVIRILPRVKGAYGIKGKLIGQSSALETKPARAPQPHRRLYLAGAHLGSDAPGAAPALSEVPPARHVCPPPPGRPCATCARSPPTLASR